MADKTEIEWTDATWNVITGCSVVSPGCTNCYAMLLAGTRLSTHASREGLTKDTKAGPVWTGEVRFNEYWLDQPLHWRRPRRVFFCAHGDAFHDQVPVEWLDLSFAVMAACDLMKLGHQFQVLTKRAAGMHAYFNTLHTRADEIMATVRKNWTGWDEDFLAFVVMALVNWRNRPLANVWLGVSAEDQTRADERVPDLLAIPAALHWVSHEPALGPINFRALKPRYPSHQGEGFKLDALAGVITRGPGGSEVCQAEGRLDWIVSGGESGADARVSHPEWYRAIRDDCKETGVAWNFKQWGNWAPIELPEGSRVDLDSIGAGKVPIIHMPPGFDAPVIKKGKCVLIGIDGTGQLKAPLALMHRVTKKSAGAVLDGEYHRAMPLELVL